jgi:hypothetical protein
MGSEYKRSKVGFPIRKSSDQSLFAAPQGLSQRTTSFIASQRQGIHRMPLRHLITLMIDVRRSAATDSIQKDHLLPNPSGSPEGDLPVREHACRTHPIPARQSQAGRWAIVSPNSRICSLFTISKQSAFRRTLHDRSASTDLKQRKGNEDGGVPHRRA